MSQSSLGDQKGRGSATLISSVLLFWRTCPWSSIFPEIEMTSKVLADRVRSPAGGDGVPSLQRSQAVDYGEKDSLDPNLVSRLDSGLGAGTTCLSMDGNENGNMAAGVSSTGGLNETSAGQVFRRQEEFANDKSNNESTALGEAGYDEAGLCSEEDVLNFTFKVCDTESTGRVAASVIIQYLREMTGQDTDGRLQVLHNMLDPERKDVAVDRGSFHLTMRRWIANCTQDGPSDEKASLNLRENPRLQSTEGKWNTEDTVGGKSDPGDPLSRFLSTMYGRMSNPSSPMTSFSTWRLARLLIFAWLSSPAMVNDAPITLSFESSNASLFLITAIGISTSNFGGRSRCSAGNAG
ncbi:uncharacterized protein LOC134354191 [Mobula hypostoma]|uniref:uncharacterized protein LOC134354191 n=1 Tax=Mobula hypostoma TaxID=723540 RepID=UPI002FC34681